MIISTKGRYALQVMVDLAEHPSPGYTPLQEIVKRQGSPREYVSAILKTLVENGLLDSLRGKGGGYRLKGPPSEYRVGDILRAAEGSLAPINCLLEENLCPNSPHCRFRVMWNELDRMISAYLDNLHLSEFLPGGRFYSVCALGKPFWEKEDKPR